MTTTDQNRVYFISPWRRALLWWILGPFLLLGAWLALGGDDAERTAGVAVMVLMGVMLAGWQWLVSRTRLVLTTEGVRLYQFGMRMEAHWRDIEALRLVRGHEGFVTRAPMEGKGAARLAALRGIGIRGAPLYSEEQRDFMAARRWIPIEPFGWYLRRGRLAEDIARLAPEIVASTEPALSPAQSRRNVTGTIVVVAILIAVLGAAVAITLAPEDMQNRILTVVHALIAPLITWRAAWSTRDAFRAPSVLLGLLFGCLTLFMACWWLVAWKNFFDIWQ